MAAVMEALLACGWQARFADATGGDLSTTARERLIALAFLHDLGKTNLGFWRRQFDGAQSIGYTAEVLACLDHEALGERIAALTACGPDLFYAMLAHHGRPVVARPRFETHPLWKAADGYDPLVELEALITEAAHRYPAAFVAEGSLLPPRAAALFAGLLTLADWIGSDPRRFPIDGVTGTDRTRRSREAASAAVDGLGLGEAGALARHAAAVSFSDAFGVPLPREAQVRAGDPCLGTLTILEVKTGSGKTEAALWRFLRLLAAGEIDALYFALPTRTSAVQMHRRVQACLDATFGEGAIEAVQAVPGYIQAGERQGHLLERFDVLWPDRERDAIEDARWAAEAPKRYLAARVTVGTIDQALLGALRVRHAHLRAACLTRSLLVVDEVHASDTYMSEVLGRVLDNHRAVGGHAMLLSATLGAEARTRFMAGRNAAPPPFTKARAVPYPALHGSDVGMIPVSTDGRRKTIALDLTPGIADPTALAGHALAAAQKGSRVLVIRNTVTQPERPLFLGRKPCLPSGPILVGRHAAPDALAALAHRMALEGVAPARVQWGIAPGEEDAESTRPGAELVRDGFRVRVERRHRIADERRHQAGVHAGTRPVAEGTLVLESSAAEAVA